MNYNMPFFEVLKKRRSIRVFESRKIGPEAITELIKAIQSAPSAGNLQAYQAYLVENQTTIQLLGQAAYDQNCVLNAPAVLVFCADWNRSAREYGERGRSLYCIQDATIAATLAHLAAVALGLGSVMVGAFNEREVARIINAPDTQIPILLFPFGYPAKKPSFIDRRTVDDLVIRL